VYLKKRKGSSVYMLAIIAIMNRHVFFFSLWEYCYINDQ
jgi:hypothetical protein